MGKLEELRARCETLQNLRNKDLAEASKWRDLAIGRADEILRLSDLLEAHGITDDGPEPEKRPTAATHDVVAEINLPIDVRLVAKMLKVIEEEHPGAVVIYDGPLAKKDVLVIGAPRRTAPSPAVPQS